MNYINFYKLQEWHISQLFQKSNYLNLLTIILMLHFFYAPPHRINILYSTDAVILLSLFVVQNGALAITTLFFYP